MSEDLGKNATAEAALACIRGEFDTAENLFKKALSDFPDSSYAHHDYAVFLAEFKEDLETASNEFFKAANLEPKLAHHQYEAGLCALKLGKFDQALAWMKKVKSCGDFVDFVGERGIDLDVEIKAIENHIILPFSFLR